MLRFAFIGTTAVQVRAMNPAFFEISATKAESLLIEKQRAQDKYEMRPPISETSEARRSVAHAAEFAGDPPQPET